MKSKTLGVCGDSWFAASQDLPRPDCEDADGRHFSEIMAKRLGYNLFTLAKSAYREQQDAWIIASGIQQIRSSGIPYLLLSHHEPPTDYFQADTLACEVFGTTQPDMVPQNAPCANGSTPRRWHTSDQFQVEYADKLLRYLRKHNLLKSNQARSALR